MAANTLGAFSQFMALTRDLPMSGPDKIMNLAQTYRTYFLKHLFSGSTPKDYFKGGTKLTEKLTLDYTGSAYEYLPGETHTYSADSADKTLEVPWRFLAVSSTWTDHEMELNNDDPQSTYKDQAIAIRQKMYTKFWDKLEAIIWGAPDATEMEGGNTAGKKWMSIRALITMSGGAPNTTAVTTAGGDGGSGTFSTVQAIDPTLTNYQNQYITYASANIDNELLPALDEMYVKVNFQPPVPGGGKTGIDETNYSKLVIATSLPGYKKLIQLANAGVSVHPEAANIGWANGKVHYNGVPIVYVAALDNIFHAPSGGQLTATTKPPFYFLNLNTFKMFFKKDRFLKAKTFDGTPSQPFSSMEIRDTWGNLCCTDKRPNGLVRFGS